MPFFRSLAEKTLKEIQGKASGVVILHGSDTQHYMLSGFSGLSSQPF